MTMLGQVPYSELTRKSAHDQILRICRKHRRGDFLPAMRSGVQENAGKKVVVDLAHWSRDPLFVGDSWEDILEQIQEKGRLS